MLNPISALLNLQQLQNIIKDNPQHFNATLPLFLKVLEKKGDNKYLLQLGNQILETKSAKPLIIGQKYWALMQKSSVGAIMLSNLIPQPKIMEQLKNAPLKLELQQLNQILKQEDFKGYHEQLVTHLTHAQSRQDFWLLGNLLLSLQHQVASFVIKDKHQEALIQIKNKKGKQKQLDFYALYPHLGALQGHVLWQEPHLSLHIVVLYENTARLLEQYKNTLKGFDAVYISASPHTIEPLFGFEESLLDTRG
ncbi:hypothetical protein NHP200010_12850 [Helicobacter bizzozeronii]|uniref:hypothetical protein n=1 Tax=Helicobacter bizzozeronii TaxID=56877 RepID=UPI00244D8D6D|nr:hypothetical protein [Helicobacter bizzozeronii]GMB93563.1 hypothetical protein NHP200010_12850 [Helicobacter bizzozeronii]